MYDPENLANSIIKNIHFPWNFYLRFSQNIYQFVRFARSLWILHSSPMKVMEAYKSQYPQSMAQLLKIIHEKNRSNSCEQRIKSGGKKKI